MKGKRITALLLAVTLAVPTVPIETNATEISSAQSKMIEKLSVEDNIASGVIDEGDRQITWVIDSDGKLTITGTGNINSDVPWTAYKSQIVSAQINVDGMTTTQNLFYDYDALKEVDFCESDTSNVTVTWDMFYSCNSLEKIDLSHFDTSNVQDMDSMFQGCTSLKELDLSNFDMSSVTYPWGMLSECYSLEKIKTPINCSMSVELPTRSSYYLWSMPDGTVITELPQNTTESIEIVKTHVGEWAIAPTINLVEEDGRVTGIEFYNNDVEYGAVYWGVATKKELETDTIYSFGGTWIYGGTSTGIMDLEILARGQYIHDSEYYIVAYTEVEGKDRSEWVVLEDYPITSENIEKEETVVYQKGDITENLFFTTKSTDKYNRAEVEILYEDYEGYSGSFDRTLSIKNDVFCLETEYLDHEYEEWSVQKSKFYKINVTQDGCTVEKEIYSSVTEGEAYEEVRVEAPTIILNRNENGEATDIYVRNLDEEDSFVYYGLATKEEIESGEVDYYSSDWLGNFQTTWGANLSDMIRSEASESGEYFIIGYAENENKARSELTVIAEYPINVITTSKEETLEYQTGTFTGHGYFTEKSTDEYAYARVRLLIDNSWNTSWSLSERNGMFYFDIESLNENYDEWSIESVEFCKINTLEVGCAVEKEIYVSVVEGDSFEEARAGAPILTLKRDSQGVITGINLKNNDEEYGDVYYGLATKEDIESGMVDSYSSCWLSGLDSTYELFSWFVPYAVSETGEYYVFAYTENYSEARSELTVLEDYPFTVTVTSMQESLEYHMGNVTDYTYITEKSTAEYDYAKAKIRVRDVWGSSWTSELELEEKNEIFRLDTEYLNQNYEEWSLEEFEFVNYNVESSGCIVEKEIYTSIVEGDVYEEPRTAAPTISLSMDDKGNVVGFYVQNNDEEESYIGYGFATKEEIESGEIDYYFYTWLENSETYEYLWESGIANSVSTTGEYYFVAYAANYDEVSSESSVLESYPIIIEFEEYSEDAIKVYVESDAELEQCHYVETNVLPEDVYALYGVQQYGRKEAFQKTDDGTKWFASFFYNELEYLQIAADKDGAEFLCVNIPQEKMVLEQRELSSRSAYILDYDYYNAFVASGGSVIVQDNGNLQISNEKFKTDGKWSLDYLKYRFTSSNAYSFVKNISEQAKRVANKYWKFDDAEFKAVNYYDLEGNVIAEDLVSEHDVIVVKYEPEIVWVDSMELTAPKTMQYNESAKVTITLDAGQDKYPFNREPQIRYESSNPEVVAVDEETGELTAGTVDGVATITAYADEYLRAMQKSRKIVTASVDVAVGEYSEVLLLDYDYYNAFIASGGTITINENAEIEVSTDSFKTADKWSLNYLYKKFAASEASTLVKNIADSVKDWANLYWDFGWNNAEAVNYYDTEGNVIADDEVSLHDIVLIQYAPKNVGVVSVELNAPEKMGMNETAQTTITLSAGQNKYPFSREPKIRYESSNPRILAVDEQTGVLTSGNQVGVATITAYVDEDTNGISSSVSIMVGEYCKTVFLDYDYYNAFVASGGSVNVENDGSVEVSTDDFNTDDNWKIRYLYEKFSWSDIHTLIKNVSSAIKYFANKYWKLDTGAFIARNYYDTEGNVIAEDKLSEHEIVLIKYEPEIVWVDSMKLTAPETMRFNEIAVLTVELDAGQDKYPFERKPEIRYESSNPRIVAVDAKTGELTAGQVKGTATITAYADETLRAREGLAEIVTASVKVTVQSSEEPKTPVTEVFNDVFEGSWYIDAVQYVYDNGIMSGSGGLFSPDNAVTRAMVVETLYKMEGRPTVTDYTQYEQFGDLNRSQWWADSVAWAMNEGIATGDTYYKTFSPEKAVTREQFATFLYRYAEGKGLDVTLSSDASEILGSVGVSEYAKTAFAWAVDQGIITGMKSTDASGKEYTDLAPFVGATRAQLATMLQRFCEKYNAADDTDADAVLDGIEEYFGASTEVEDTDGDGLTDYTEIYETGTDPTLRDTDKNEISDADEDLDADQLSNLKEQELGTNPTLTDTDDDGLSDGQEINEYGTNPIKEDTDGDGLIDADEIELGLDPLNASTDGITADNERTFEQTTDDSAKDEALKNSENWLDVSVSGEVSGIIDKNVSMEEGSVYSLESNRSVVSDIVDVHTDYEVPVTLSFECSKSYSGDINNLNIMTHTEDGLMPMETYIDETEETINCELQDSGTYFVVDLDEFLKGLGIDVFNSLSSEYPASTFSARMDFTTTNSSEKIYASNDEVYEIETYGDIEENVIIENDLTVESTYATRKVSTSDATGKADVVFVIDTTGSMGSAIAGVRSNVGAFAKALVDEYNIDVNFALIEYQDITIDGKESTKIHPSTTSNWYTNVDSYINEVNNLSVSGGGDTPETPIDALQMARNLDWRGDATKFVILVTDANAKDDNTCGITDIEEMSTLLVNDNIITSAIAKYESDYEQLTVPSGGLYGDVYADFSNILIELANMVGDETNSGGEWVFLDDFQAVKLGNTLENASSTDTDGDGYSDAEELGNSEKVNMEPYVSLLLNKHSIPADAYVGKKTLTVWNYISNPTLLDTDYDGISDGTKDYDGSVVANPDKEPRRSQGTSGTDGNTFKGSVTANEFKMNVSFKIDYSLFFNDLSNYNKNLSKMGIIYSLGAYHNDFDINSGAVFTGNDETLMKNFGMKDVTAYKLAKDYTDDDLSEITIGHREVTYQGVTKDIILISVRGTDSTIEEWSSNFDVGAYTDEYWDKDNEDWEGKQNHKGFDVAANRLDKQCIQDYINNLNTSTPKVIFITGHSRGAAIANILAAMYVDRGYTTVAYTMATPNTTLKKNTDSYKTIFNIVNTDDLVPQLPLDDWEYGKYGKIYPVSVEEKYEDKFGPYEDGTWEAMFDHDYNYNGNLSNTMKAFAKVLKNRDQIYHFTGEDDTIYYDRTKYETEEDAIKAVDKLRDRYGIRISRFCKFYTVETEPLIGDIYYRVAVEQSPAALMMILTDVIAKKQHNRTDDGKDYIEKYKQRGAGEDKFYGHNIGFYVADKYEDAKSEFVWSGADSTGGTAMKLRMGGMAHTHMPGTYYLIVNDGKNCIK